MKFKPMLAATVRSLDDLDGRYPLLASPKLDGIRFVKQEGQVLTRSLKPVPNAYVRDALSRLPDGVDGELMLRNSSGGFPAVSSAVMRRNGAPDFVAFVFDFFSNLPYRARVEHLRTLQVFQGGGSGHVAVLDSIGVCDRTVLEATINYHVARGYEGTMLRDPGGPYKQGRSTLREGYLMKVKSFNDDDATVVTVHEMMHNDNPASLDALGHLERSTAKSGLVPLGVLGALCCEMEDGTRFSLGAGFTAGQRADLWARRDSLPGLRLKFKHQPPSDGRPPGAAPRFPVFLAWRED